jgi:hypothetical protein
LLHRWNVTPCGRTGRLLDEDRTKVPGQGREELALPKAGRS